MEVGCTRLLQRRRAGDHSPRASSLTPKRHLEIMPASSSVFIVIFLRARGE
jgi:hypothetical protein